MAFMLKAVIAIGRCGIGVNRCTHQNNKPAR